jgi:4-hydroxybenzoate polyprenyltransferase
VKSAGGLATVRSFTAFAADIKIAHSIFALPFAASAFIIGGLPIPTAPQVLLLLGCMVSARSFAMGMNRFLDRKIDAENPRTVRRKIPAGELSPQAGLAWSLAWALLFVALAAALSPLAGWCAVPMLVVLMSYSFMKRLTWLTHWYLGACLGLAPVAVAIAITGGAPAAVFLVGISVCLWTAGFDILYSLQDLAFDRDKGLRSVPGAFGPAASLWISRACFVVMTALLALAGILAARQTLYFVGVAVVAAILAYEQWLVRDARHTGSSTNINVAFFNANAYVSVVFFAFCMLDLWL